MSERWFHMKTDRATGRQTHIRFADNGDIVVRETIPANYLNAHMDFTTAVRNDWDGWRGKKIGAVVSSVPADIDMIIKRRSGLERGQHDAKKYNQILRDDFPVFITAGGKW